MQRIILVDDDGRFRSLLQSMLDASDEFTVVGGAATADEAFALTATQKPDVVISDIDMPGDDGFELARRLNAYPSPPRIILTSGLADRRYEDLATEHGAVGFIPKARVSVEEISRMLEPNT